MFVSSKYFHIKKDPTRTQVIRSIENDRANDKLRSPRTFQLGRAIICKIPRARAKVLRKVAFPSATMATGPSQSGRSIWRIDTSRWGVGEGRAPLVNSDGDRSAHRCSADIVAIKASIITPLIEASCLEATGQIVQITSRQRSVSWECISTVGKEVRLPPKHRSRWWRFLQEITEPATFGFRKIMVDA